MTLRIGLWCAVSSRAQAADDKSSLEDQEAAGRQFAQSLDADVVAVYRVPGHTRDIWRWEEAEAEMPAYAQLRADIESGRIDVLHAIDMDRLGRDPALGQQVLSLVEKGAGATLPRAEVYLASAPHTIGSKTIGHRYISAIQAVRAGEDQVLRVRRYRSGMRGRILKRGLLPARPPFYLDPVHDERGEVAGYRYNERAGALDLVTDLFLAGHAYAEIARRLNSGPYPPPEGKRWWHYTVNLLMHSDIPAGYPSWGDLAPETPSPALPARWDPETHAAVQRERARRDRSGYHRRGSGPYSGVAVCGRCGAGMIRHQTSHSLRHGFRAYNLRCGRHACKSIYPEMTCHPNYLPEEEITAALSAFFAAFLDDPALLDQAVAEISGGNERQRLEGALARDRRQAADLETRRTRLAHALAGGSLDPAMYRQVDDAVLQDLEATGTRIQRAERALAALPDAEALRASLARLAAEFPDLVARADPAETATVLQAAAIQVVCENGGVLRIEVG